MNLGYGAGNHVVLTMHGWQLFAAERRFPLGPEEELIGARPRNGIGDVLEFPWGSWAVTALRKDSTTIRKVLV